MSLFQVDQSKCQNDGICAEICPVGILQMNPETKIPEMIAGAEKICINCGHCVAVCPHGAVSLATMPVEQCTELHPGWSLSPEQVSQFLKGRRSVRVYKTEQVERSILENLIDTARFAPSGINLQPLSWKVVCEPQKVQDLARQVIAWMKTLVEQQSPLAQGLRLQRIVAGWDRGIDLVCRQAPHLVIAYGLKDDMTAPQASMIALTYLELIAASHGLGACWAGYVQIAATMDSAVKKMLGLRSRECCFGAMLIGYPKYKYCRVPMRNPVKISWI